MKQELIEAEGTDDLVIHPVVVEEWNEDDQLNADLWNSLVRADKKNEKTESGIGMTVSRA